MEILQSKRAWRSLVNKGVKHILIIPLYPQFAMATTETILVLAEQIQNEFFPDLELTSLPPFYNHPDYIKVLGTQFKRHSKERIGIIYYFPTMVYQIGT